MFIDANIFVYHFTGVSSQCTWLLERCEHGDVLGFTTAHIVLEVAHRLMMLEAVTKGLVTAGKVAKKLKERPEVVRQLRQYADHAFKIEEMGITVIPVTLELWRESTAYQKRYGLLTNDALLVSACRSYGYVNLASDDNAFAVVDEVRLFQPGDL